MRCTYRHFVILSGLTCMLSCRPGEPESLPENRMILATVLERSVREDVLSKWYPYSVDETYGGFFSTYTHDFQLTGPQDKMIVTQARHVWVNALCAELYPEVEHYKQSAAQGYNFLRNVMWDNQYGGFYGLVDRQGNVKSESKTSYGNAFAMYALAAYYKTSGDTSALELAKKTFYWQEEHAHDPEYGGYFQNFKQDGTPYKNTDETSYRSLFGFKGQNTSIHTLEAFTEFYQVWPDSLLRERLTEIFYIVRDTIVNKKGYLHLYFYKDWTPFSLQDSTEEAILRYHGLDHVSFGHDVETAYLLLEAAQVLGLANDTTTWQIAQRMVDHALQRGWDEEQGGFYEEAYYFKDKGFAVTHDTKNWWAQAEGLNALLIMADQYPGNSMQYFDKFRKQWEYIDTHLIDHEHGDWYQGGLDKDPEQKTRLKGSIWKGTYHHVRALTNCIRRLQKEETARIKTE